MNTLEKEYYQKPRIRVIELKLSGQLMADSEYDSNDASASTEPTGGQDFD